MDIAHQAGHNYILAFRRGEEVVESFRQFLVAENIRASRFSGLGAAESLEIAFYNLEAKEYEKRKTNYDVEILSLSGNTAMMEGQPVIHVHGTFAKRDFSAFGGHVFSIVVGGACEIHLTVLDGLMTRQYDEKTGLNLLCGL